MADYSHLAELHAVWPRTVVDFKDRGEKPTDEMFLEAFERISPPLLAEQEANVVRAALVPRRGRPPNDAPQLEDVAQNITLLDRPDVPRAFIDLLADRLRQGERYTSAHFGTELLRAREKRERKTFVWFIYDGIYDLLKDAGKFIEHPIFGRLEVPRDERARSEKALAITHHILHNLMDRHPPSIRRLQNIITERNRGLKRESSKA